MLKAAPENDVRVANPEGIPIMRNQGADPIVMVAIIPSADPMSAGISNGSTGLLALAVVVDALPDVDISLGKSNPQCLENQRGRRKQVWLVTRHQNVNGLLHRITVKQITSASESSPSSSFVATVKPPAPIGVSKSFIVSTLKARKLKIP